MRTPDDPPATEELPDVEQGDEPAPGDFGTVPQNGMPRSCPRPARRA